MRHRGFLALMTAILSLSIACSDMLGKYDDEVTPSGGFTINDGAAKTISRAVTLSMDIQNATEMRFSNDGAVWSEWEPYAASKLWDLALGPQLQTVRGEFKSKEGNTLSASDNIDPFIEEKIVASILTPSSYFGGGHWNFTAANVALSHDGKTLIAASFPNSKVFAYKWVNNQWNETIVVSPHASPIAFGNSIDCTPDGKTSIIGAINNAEAYLFSWDGSSYVYQKTFTSPTPAVTNDYAVTVAISDNAERVAIGSWHNLNMGAVYLYDKNGGSWNETKFIDPEIVDGNVFGLGVNISGNGNTIVVGSPSKDNRKGALYIYRWENNNWNMVKISTKDGVNDDLLGRQLGISYNGNRIIAGMRIASAGNLNQGAAYIFDWNGSAWMETKLMAADGYANDKFGFCVSMNSDGNTVAVSAPGPQTGALGKAYIYRFNGTIWNEEKIMSASDGTTGDFYGNLVSISGDGSTIAVGAPMRESNRGAVYVY
ncbi:MAG: FG-GAP repeat protein [Spirochaetes bacterium]|nr:FG-GAP repeat protein [Spirochaetota bacterium]